MIEMDKCTGYQWCLDNNMRILNLSDYKVSESTDYEKDYFTLRVTKEKFLEALKKCGVKPNSIPRKTLPYLEYRMYGLVPYNISSIQGAIQYGHALQEYNNMLWETNVNDKIVTAFRKWSLEDKTFIILNGGTTNENKTDRFYGSLQQSRDTLTEKDITFAEFKEPDLNNALTAVVFLVDERVFNTELYPNYIDMPFPWIAKGRGYRPAPAEMSKWENENNFNRAKWVEKIGGTKNDFLRTWLRNFRLAN